MKPDREKWKDYVRAHPVQFDDDCDSPDIKRLDELKERRAHRKVQFDNDSESYRKREALRAKNREDFKDSIWNVILHGQGQQFLEAFSGSRKSKERFLEQVLERYQT